MPRLRLVRTLTGVFVLKVTLSTVLLVVAASSMVSTTNYRALIGGQLNVVSALSPADKGFAKSGTAISANGTDCSSKVLFGPSALVATRGVTNGDMVYDLQLNTTGTTGANGCWQASLTYTTNAGSLTTVGPVWIGTGASPPSANDLIDCKFDVGSSLPSSPFSYAVAVTA